MFIVLKFQGKVKGIKTERQHIFVETTDIGLSLGRVIFWNEIGGAQQCKNHEYGHAMQSKLLGPFYLFVVGIPSVCRFIYSNLYAKKHKVSWNGYFKGFPENWADRLGGVNRNKMA